MYVVSETGDVRLDYAVGYKVLCGNCTSFLDVRFCAREKLVDGLWMLG